MKPWTPALERGDSGGITPRNRSAEYDWEVYLTWCEIHHLEQGDPAALEAFLRHLTPRSAARTRDTVATIRVRAGIPPPVAPRVHPRSLRAGEASLEVALTRLAATEHQRHHALRDAVALLIVLDLGLSNATARRTRAHTWPVPGLGTSDYPLGADPRTCKACAVTRWLRTLANARLTLVDDTRPEGHDCLHPVPDGWQAGPLLPAIDRWDSIQAHHPRPISGRTLTAILSSRLATASADDVAPPPPVPATSAHPLPNTMTALEAARRRRALREEFARLMP